MYHYVYLLEFEDGMGYIGVHSTVIKPELDTCYLGSGKHLPLRTLQSCSKHILKEFSSREEAIAYEIELIDKNNCVASPLWYNARRKTHDKHGSSLSKEHRERISKTHSGIKRPEYAKKYRGEGRTPAQRAGDVSAGLKLRGTKCPAKGSSGISNSGFTPWYYITPNGKYVEVYDTPKQDYAHKLGFTPRQLGHRFHYTNEHKESNRSPFKGWTFGNLPRPTDMGSD
jgi:predicted GIY-YIG superfamily endonuclease